MVLRAGKRVRVVGCHGLGILADRAIRRLVPDDCSREPGGTTSFSSKSLDRLFYLADQSAKSSKRYRDVRSIEEQDATGKIRCENVAGGAIEIFASGAHVDERDVTPSCEYGVMRAVCLDDLIAIPPKYARDHAANLRLLGEKKNSRAIAHA